MNLIRNGGFETGDMTFWETISASVIGVSDVETYKGVYSLKMQSLTGENPTVRTGDYIAVAYNELYTLLLHMYANAGLSATVRIEEYDDELNLLTTSYLGNVGITPAWSEHKMQYTAPDGVSYVRVRAELVPNVPDDYMYLDNVSVSRVKPVDLGLDYVELANIVNETFSGDTAADKKDMIGFKRFMADFRVTSLTGTAPTLDVDIMEASLAGGTVLLASFTQASGVTSERIALPLCDGRQVYIVYTLGGVVTDADFRCGLIAMG